MPAPQEFDDLTLYLRRTAILRVMRYISRGQDARTTRVWWFNFIPQKNSNSPYYEVHI